MIVAVADIGGIPNANAQGYWNSTLISSPGGNDLYELMDATFPVGSTFSSNGKFAWNSGSIFNHQNYLQATARSAYGTGALLVWQFNTSFQSQWFGSDGPQLNGFSTSDTMKVNMDYNTMATAPVPFPPAAAGGNSMHNMIHDYSGQYYTALAGSTVTNNFLGTPASRINSAGNHFSQFSSTSNNINMTNGGVIR